MRRTMFFLILTMLVFTRVSSASYIVVDEPSLQGSVILGADLYNQKQNIVLIGQGHNVYLVQDNDKKELITDIPGQISALATGDVTGDLRNNLVIGTTNAGALYFYSEKGGLWERQGQPHYLWDTIEILEIHDFNNDGWGDLVVLTAKGEIQILLSWEGKLYPFWKSAANQTVIDFQVLDVNKDGYPDLIYTFQSGYIGILGWDDQEFITIWENYPWGLIESLVVVSNQADPEWLVITSQKMLYGWRWRDGEVVSSRHFHAHDLGENLFYIPQEGLLSFSKKTGASLFQLKSSTVEELWRVPGVFGNKAFYFNGDYLFRDSAQNYYRLVQGSGQWRILVNDQEITDLVQIFTRDGVLYYNINDLAPELGFKVMSLDYWHFLRDDRYIKLKPDNNVVECNGLNIPIANPIVEKDGIPYASAEVFALFGWIAEIDAARKNVVFLKNWGWWLESNKVF